MSTNNSSNFKEKLLDVLDCICDVNKKDESFEETKLELLNAYFNLLEKTKLSKILEKTDFDQKNLAKFSLALASKQLKDKIITECGACSRKNKNRLKECNLEYINNLSKSILLDDIFFIMPFLLINENDIALNKFIRLIIYGNIITNNEPINLNLKTRLYNYFYEVFNKKKSKIFFKPFFKEDLELYENCKKKFLKYI